FTSKRYNLQGYSSGLSIGNFSIAKDFCKDRLSLTFTGNISLKNGKYLKFNSVSSGSDYINTTDMKFKIANLGVSLSWRFGQQGVRVKKTAKSINNDDFSKDQKSSSDTPGM
ncbi:MAG: hypothetical protein IJ150_03275, partial [Bacteroidales bacterium]|nr:hypothetical protein [Bacteroidales bacterium]